MSISLYEITVPVMISAFDNMSKFLDRGTRICGRERHPALRASRGTSGG